jgi:hypothetical protein
LRSSKNGGADGFNKKPRGFGEGGCTPVDLRQIDPRKPICPQIGFATREFIVQSLLNE